MVLKISKSVFLERLVERKENLTDSKGKKVRTAPIGEPFFVNLPYDIDSTADNLVSRGILRKVPLPIYHRIKESKRAGYTVGLGHSLSQTKVEKGVLHPIQLYRILR